MVGFYLFLPFHAPSFFASWKRVENYKDYRNLRKVASWPVKFSARVFCVNVSDWWWGFWRLRLRQSTGSAAPLPATTARSGFGLERRSILDALVATLPTPPRHSYTQAQLNQPRRFHFTQTFPSPPVPQSPQSKTTTFGSFPLQSSISRPTTLTTPSWPAASCPILQRSRTELYFVELYFAWLRELQRAASWWRNLQSAIFGPFPPFPCQASLCSSLDPQPDNMWCIVRLYLPDQHPWTSPPSWWGPAH